MGETRDSEQKAKDASELPKTSSILGQAPFKLDLRIVPRHGSTGSTHGSPDVIRLTPVDRALLPEPEQPVIAPPIEVAAPTTVATDTPTSPPPPTAPAATAQLTPPPPPTPSAPPPPPALTLAPAAATAAVPALAQTVAPGVAANMPNITAPFVARAMPSAGQLTLAPIAPRVAEQKPIDFHAILGASARPQSRRKRRNPLGALVKLLVLAGLIGGGYVAVKKYVLDATWQGDVKVLADDVADRRGLAFEEPVPVEVLQYDEYAAALASSVLGVSAADADALGSEWRAVGLAEGKVDMAAIGRAALADQPAFYDPAAGKIYELADVSPELRGIALSQALTMALLDQHFDWAATAASTDSAVRNGTRALFEGDAAAIRAETTAATLVDPAEIADVSREIGMLRVSAMDDSASASPFGVALVRSGSEATSELFPQPIDHLARNRIDQTAIASDAAVFDGARGLAAVPAAAPVPNAKSVGMMYWYYALAGRIGSDAAWAAAVNWNGDATVIEQSTPGSSCVTSKITAIDAAGQQEMLSAFDAWVAAAPVESKASVVTEGTDRLVVKSCDPGTEASTIVFTDIVPFGHAPTEMAVVAAMVGAGMKDTPAARACVVQGLRDGNVVTVSNPEAVDRSLTTATVDLDTPVARTLQETCAGA